MRAFIAIVLAAGVPITIGYVVACGPPDTFDNITGGQPKGDAASNAEAAPLPLTEDVELTAPRAIAPLAGSWVNGSRPRFRWESSTPAAVGARVLVCKDPSCDPATTKSWDATGNDFTVPEDLPSGRYIWKLRTTTATTFSTKTSPAWSLLVRGGQGDGTPSGLINDLNGDGISDLLVTIDIAQGGEPLHDALGLLGTSREDPLLLSTDPFKAQPLDFQVGITADMKIQVVDIDGDGIGDPIFTDANGPSQPGKFSVQAFRGAINIIDSTPLGDRPLIPGLDAFPTVTAAGDVDGDGHGDVLVGTKSLPFVLFGATDGITKFAIVSAIPTMANADAGILPPPTAPIPLGGVDVDHDGKLDVAMPSFLVDEGLLYKISIGRSFLDPEVPIDPDAGIRPTPATNFGFGDVDGDGSNDTAFATTVAGKAAVCILTSAAETTTGRVACWSPATVPAGFASSIIGADLEGDGKDEFLVGTAGGGIDVLRLPTADKVEAEHLAVDYGGTMTVLDPGRPKAAVWVATRMDGTSLALFQGKEQKRLIALTDVANSIPYPISRFQSGLR